MLLVVLQYVAASAFSFLNRLLLLALPYRTRLRVDGYAWNLYWFLVIYGTSGQIALLSPPYI